MSFVSTVPPILATAASDLASIGSAIDAANASATAPTTAILVAGADEVSAAVQQVFSAHARAFQEVSAQAAQFHAEFVQSLTGAGGAYAAAEAANVSPLQGMVQAVVAQASPNVGYGNVGYGNVGTGNVGFFNTGDYNFGISNTGSLNIGIANVSPNFAVDLNNISIFGGIGLFNNGIDNIGAFNTGNINIGIGNVSPNFTFDPANITAFGNLGLFNNGIDNVGIGNVGTGNTGFPLSLVGLLGVGNHGDYNQGLFNYGNYDLGIGLVGDHKIGVGPFYVVK